MRIKAILLSWMRNGR